MNQICKRNENLRDMPSKYCRKYLSPMKTTEGLYKNFYRMTLYLGIPAALCIYYTNYPSKCTFKMVK